jgi:hypothetical protein
LKTSRHDSLGGKAKPDSNRVFADTMPVGLPWSKKETKACKPRPWNNKVEGLLATVWRRLHKKYPGDPAGVNNLYTQSIQGAGL